MLLVLPCSTTAQEEEDLTDHDYITRTCMRKKWSENFAAATNKASFCFTASSPGCRQAAPTLLL